METQILSSPVIQLGFAGFCLIQFVVIVWLIRQLLVVVKTSNGVNSKLTKVIESLGIATGRTNEMLDRILEKLLSRPCMMEPETLQVIRREVQKMAEKTHD